MQHDSRRFLGTMVADGRPLISLTGICLALSGAFALFQSATGHFLPHDIAYLQMSAEELCGINECRIVHFMIHDRVSFGGVLIAIGVLYLWLAEFPLHAGQAWAWWTLLISAVLGFGSFLTYLSYGYLDSWHGAATLALLPCFAAGLGFSRRIVVQVTQASGGDASWRSLLKQETAPAWRTKAGIGRGLLLLSAIGMIGGGITIQLIGTTEVFVDTDLEYLGLTREQMNLINPRLIPLIAHDRAGFGGGVTTGGFMLLACIWCSRLGPALWQALLLAGIAGWSTSIGIHPVVGYNHPLHLAPAVTGAVLFFGGLILTYSEGDTPT